MIKLTTFSQTIKNKLNDTPTYVGFLCTQTFKYTRKHIRLTYFHKTFTINCSNEQINDSIRLVSKPVYIIQYSSMFVNNFLQIFLNSYTAQISMFAQPFNF